MTVQDQCQKKPSVVVCELNEMEEGLNKYNVLTIPKIDSQKYTKYCKKIMTYIVFFILTFLIFVVTLMFVLILIGK